MEIEFLELELSGGACALGGTGAAEGFNMQLDGADEGENGDADVRRVSRSSREASQGYQFWAQGYCVGTLGLNERRIRKYVEWQEKQDQRQEQFRIN